MFETYCEASKYAYSEVSLSRSDLDRLAMKVQRKHVPVSWTGLRK